MTSSINFSSRATFAFLLATLFFGIGCAAGSRNSIGNSGRHGVELRIAVLPVVNLSGQPAPVKEMRRTFIKKMEEKGFAFLEDDILEIFMAKKRIRYTGGIDRETALAFKEIENVDAVVIIHLGLYNTNSPPKIALMGRMVSTGNTPEIMWMESVGLAGDDAPGFLGLGVIETLDELREVAFRKLADSLGGHATGRNMRDAKERKEGWIAERMRPKTAYRSPLIDMQKTYTLAVVPFLNWSDRRYAGDLIGLQFMNHLVKSGTIRVVEPGVVRQALFRWRVIIPDGLDLENANKIFSALDADLILTGKVLEYEDYQGPIGRPVVSVSVSVIEKKTQKILWSSLSYNAGDDEVFFFNWGKINTTSVLSSDMVEQITNELFGNH